MLLFFFLEKQIAGVDSKPVAPSEIVERLNTQPKPQEEATAHSNWFGSMFGSKKKEPPVQQGILWSLWYLVELVLQ